MSRQNPKKAMAALLPLEMRTVGGDTVRPMTLGMYAALERIASPMVTGDDPKDILDLIPSLYLITHDPREVFRGDLLDAAMKWADARPISTLQSIRKAAARQMNAALDVIPEEDEEDRKKKRDMTDGSRRSSTGRQGNTGGPSTKSSGKSLSRRCAS